MNWDPFHTEKLPFKWVCELMVLSELARHSWSGFEDLNSLHAPTGSLIQTDGFRWTGTTLGSTNTPFRKESQPHKEIRNQSFPWVIWQERDSNPRMNILQGSRCGTGAFGKDPAILPASGGGGKILLTRCLSFAEEGDDSWDEGRGKNSGQHPVWEKISCLPAPASLYSEPAKQVTGCGQPAAWQGLTSHVPMSLSNFHLPIFCAGSRDKRQLFPGRGGKRRQKELGKAMMASACYHCLWARAEHLEEQHEQDATASPWFNIATSAGWVSHLFWIVSLSPAIMPSSSGAFRLSHPCLLVSGQKREM